MAASKKFTAAEQARIEHDVKEKIVEKEMAVNLLARGYSVQKIVELTGLSPVEIENIKTLSKYIQYNPCY